MENTPKTLEYYKRLPYTLHTEPSPASDSTRYWIAEYLELPGCMIHGQTEADAVTNLYELFDDYISTMIETNETIPEPEHEYGIVWPAPFIQYPQDTPDPVTSSEGIKYEHAAYDQQTNQI